MRSKAGPSRSAQPASRTDSPVASARLSPGKRIVFAALAVVLGLALSEGLLALLGVRPEMYQSDPYVGFRSNGPLFIEQIGANREACLVTAENRLEFFNRQQFPKQKAPGTFRLFSLGGSTTYGHPYDDATSFNGWLRVLLGTMAPDRHWEAINAGGISYGSYRVARLMEELIHYQPDLFVVYCGHNEFLERRIYRKIMGDSRATRALNDLLRHARSATLIKSGFARLGFDGQEATGSKTLLENEPLTLLDDTAGPTAYTRDEALKEQILHHYEFNLNRMIDIAQAAGASILFVTPAANIRETTPFKSEHRPGLSEAERQRWKQCYDLARQEYAKPTPVAALNALAEAAAIDDLPASLHYVRGRVLEKLGRFAEAKLAFERARDEDVCPLRALGRIEQILERVTTSRRVPLIDFVAMQEAGSEHSIPGAAVFLDHLHPTIDGHRRLALEIIKTMESKGLVRPSWDPSLIQRATQQVLDRVDTRAHSLALMNVCKVMGWAGKREEAYRAAMRAVELGPDIASVRYEAGLAAALFSRTNQAMDHYRRALELNPKHANAHCNLGVLLEESGQFEEAIKHFQCALQFGEPRNAERDRRNLASATAKSAQARPPPGE